MNLNNLSLRDMSTLRWAVQVLKRKVKFENEKRLIYTKEEILNECDSLEERLSTVIAKHYDDY